MLREEITGALIGKLGACFVATAPALCCKAMIETFVIMQGHMRIGTETVMHRLLRFRSNEMIGGRNV